MKTLLVSLALATGLGHAADAALYRYDVTFLETVYRDVSIGVDRDDTYDRFEYARLSSRDDPWGLPRLWEGIRHGETYPFAAEVYEGHVASCTLGAYDCSIWNDDYWSRAQTDPLDFADEEKWLYVSGKGQPGDTLNIWESWYFLGGLSMADAGIYGITGDRSHHFQIARVVPTPLPLSAALLPLGLAALALQRRRRTDPGKGPALSGGRIGSPHPKCR